MAELEEGGMFDEDTMPDWMRSMRGVAPPNRQLQQQQQQQQQPMPAPFPEPMQQLPPGTCRRKYNIMNGFFYNRTELYRTVPPAISNRTSEQLPCPPKFLLTGISLT
jgi:hypothetical protein